MESRGLRPFEVFPDPWGVPKTSPISRGTFDKDIRIRLLAMYLCLWRISGPHDRNQGDSSFPFSLQEFGTPSGKALHWRGTSALRQRRLSDTSYPTDADGDLEPPRRPQGSRGITRDPKSRKATAVSPETLKFGMPHGRGPSECFWTFQKNAEDLNEVGRGVWSASLALGSFLYRQPAVFWGSLEGVTTRPSLSAKYNTAGAAESQSASKKPRGITGNTPKETLGNVVEMASTGVPKVFRILELGSGVGLIGPLLRRLFARGDFSASSLGCTKGASDLSVEVYLSDTDPEALQMCERTQRLDESILGLLHEGICPSGCREEAFGHGSSPDLAAAKSPRAHFECSPGTSVKTFVRRLDWRHGGPWAADVSGISPQTDHSRVEDDDPESQDDLTVARTRGQDAFEWTREEVEMLQKEGALSLVLASDVLYDFNLTSSLSNLLCAILEKNPSCRCLLSHSRRLGIVCPTSSVAVDIYAEDFFDRFCSSDPKEIQIASRRFLLTTHPTPPNAVVFAGYSDPVETDKVKKLIEKDLASLVEGVDGELGSHKDAQRAPRKAKEKQFRLSPSEAEEATAFAEIWELTLAETQREDDLAAVISGALPGSLEWGCHANGPTVSGDRCGGTLRAIRRTHFAIPNTPLHSNAALRRDTEAESKGKRENRLMGHQEELRAHRWTAGGTNTPTQQAPHAPENTSQDSKLKCQLDRWRLTVGQTTRVFPVALYTAHVESSRSQSCSTCNRGRTGSAAAVTAVRVATGGRAPTRRNTNKGGVCPR
ncbi:uncharacterized protein LOC34618387 [Cyclospora cayetanensis]|uniref:Uncharacterized protein LOC34618387 n=1 Tax=Cyclospora cayetanensis TaxID=88456 RepID=A0A6P6RVV7_9EIME|nr:uncharacterized protein LOC34618387 [Cyclospora cayetanensis]